jgi:hypothetical protein
MEHAPRSAATPDLHGPVQRLRRDLPSDLGSNTDASSPVSHASRTDLRDGGPPPAQAGSRALRSRNPGPRSARGEALAPTATVPRQPAHGRPIQTAAAPPAMKPVTSAGPVVGASTVSPSPKSAVKPNTKAAQPMGAVGSAARPSTAQETARISPLTARALLRRARRTRPSTNSWASTMRAVLMVSDRVTTRAGTCASTDA